MADEHCRRGVEVAFGTGLELVNRLVCIHNDNSLRLIITAGGRFMSCVQYFIYYCVRKVLRAEAADGIALRDQFFKIHLILLEVAERKEVGIGYP